ncbi:hypothetical protein MHZ92_15190 [Sporosarcina sp. ACRSL]|uniref:hypothetical protein n=1 Tax=Sporosarcina sp. ACRSL TaxID=2918215 RepID=UPI001EF6A398|nr:hypothetical protein [Sporosarcina sp. ACRSL]MCG7345481.1 hypothetical protein [Sporosarcina sp. ACRSL]
MDRLILIMLAGIVAGFALLKVPLSLTFLYVLEPITDIIAVVAILIFSLFLIYKGFKALLGKY